MATNCFDIQEVYKKDSKLKPEDVKSLLEWAEKQPHLPKITERLSILFLQSCYYSNELAKSAIDTYFTVKTLCPDIFGSRDPDTKTTKDMIKVELFTVLPFKTPENYEIIYAKLVDFNPDHYNFSVSLRLFDMFTMLRLQQNGPCEGHIVIMDMDGIVFGHLTKLSIVVMKKFLYYLQDGMPLRLKGIHFINIVSFIDKIVAMMKPFMKKELFDVLYLHENVDGLKPFCSKDSLPKEYGGKADSFAVLHEKFKQKMNDNAAHFIEEEKLLVDESKRPGKPKNIGDVFGVEGTFKKLDID